MENNFFIFCARWRLLFTTIEMSPYNVDTIVLACTALHNDTQLNDCKRWFCPSGFVDVESVDVNRGEW